MHVSHTPTVRQLGVLLAVRAAGGFIDHLDDDDAAQECVDEAWLAAEDHEGYALTLEGAAVARSHS
jgi:hypothetical protein